jgi:hypothetical protein
LGGFREPSLFSSTSSAATELKGTCVPELASAKGDVTSKGNALSNYATLVKGYADVLNGRNPTLLSTLLRSRGTSRSTSAGRRRDAASGGGPVRQHPLRRRRLHGAAQLRGVTRSKFGASHKLCLLLPCGPCGGGAGGRGSYVCVSRDRTPGGEHSELERRRLPPAG